MCSISPSFSDDAVAAVLKGGFSSFETPRPVSSQEWERRKAELRNTLWRLLGDLPPPVTPEMWEETLRWLKKHL